MMPDHLSAVEIIISTVVLVNTAIHMLKKGENNSDFFLIPFLITDMSPYKFCRLNFQLFPE